MCNCSQGKKMFKLTLTVTRYFTDTLQSLRVCILLDSMKCFLSLWHSRALSSNTSLVCRRCFIHIYWISEWLNGKLSLLQFPNLGDTEIIGRVCENTDYRIPPPDFLIQWVWGGAWEFAFLTSSQVIWKLLFWLVSILILHHSS